MVRFCEDAFDPCTELVYCWLRRETGVALNTVRSLVFGARALDLYEQSTDQSRIHIGATSFRCGRVPVVLVNHSRMSCAAVALTNPVVLVVPTNVTLPSSQNEH